MPSKQSNLRIKIRNVLKFASMFKDKGCHKYILINRNSRDTHKHWVCDRRTLDNRKDSVCHKCFVQNMPGVIELIEIAHMMGGEDGCYYVQSSQNTQD